MNIFSILKNFCFGACNLIFFFRVCSYSRQPSFDSFFSSYLLLGQNTLCCSVDLVQSTRLHRDRDAACHHFTSSFFIVVINAIFWAVQFNPPNNINNNQQPQQNIRFSAILVQVKCQILFNGEGAKER